MITAHQLVTPNTPTLQTNLARSYADAILRFKQVTLEDATKPRISLQNTIKKHSMLF